MNFHFHADDCRVYFSLDAVSSVTTTRIEACLQDIGTWMSLNKLKLKRGRKGGSRAQFTAIKKRKSRNTIINFRVSRFTENKLTHEKDLSPYPIYIILLTVVLMYFRKRSTRDCVVIGNVRFGFTALLCSRQAVA